MVRASSLVALAVACAVLGGCGSSHGGGGYSGTSGGFVTQQTFEAGPPPVTTTTTTTVFAPAATLVVFVTNSSTAVIAVQATTPDETVDVGELNPGDTVSVDLQELPSYVTLSASAVTTDANGVFPTYPDATLDLGLDYSDTGGSVGVEWQDGSYSEVAPASTARTVMPAITKR